ncbi:MAG: FKBP-type peptidyl-prolyl cis-trans isomerase [Psychrobium sp.]
MHIEKDIVVSLHYRLTDDQQQEIENSFGDVPMSYLHGHNTMIPGLEAAVEGKQAGDRLDVTITPENGYGEYVEERKQKVPVAAFEGLDPQPGMQFTADTDQGPMPVTVIEVTDEHVTVDGNHPFAGQTLHFEVEIVELRDATPTELEHGHLHQEGGCGHDHGEGESCGH